MVTLDSQIKEQINQSPYRDIRVGEEKGVLVVQVGRGTPAAKAGLREGDVIQEVNKQPVTDARTIQKLLEQTGVDGELEVGIRRRGQIATLTIRPEQLPTLQASR